MQDFPAAHSMDTTWFAIDADGYVGAFNSLEGGAVPSFDSRLYDGDLMTEWCHLSGGILRIDIDRSKLECQPTSLDTLNKTIKDAKSQALLALATHADEYSTSFEDFYSVKKIDNLILVLSSEQSVNYLLEKGCKILQFTDGNKSSRQDSPVIVYIFEDCGCKVIEIENLIGSGDIIGEIELDILDVDENINILSLILYEHGDKWENRIAGSYELSTKIPDKPLKISDLPQSLQDKIGGIKFNSLKFIETPFIQPIEYRECHSWSEERWVDTNGVQHDRFPEYPNVDRAND